MGTLEEKLARLRRFTAGVRRGDTELAEESADLRPGEELMEVVPSRDAVERAVVEESIILRRERPVLTIRDNETKLIFVDDADSEIWKSRLTKAKPFLDRAIRAVGRINLQGGRLDWVGTGWLVAEHILVTNRHVAREFALRSGDRLIFQTGIEGPMSADVDFLQEIDNPDKLVFKLIKPIHIEEPPGPDLSFFEIEVTGNGKPATPIDLATELVETESVATIGYPAYDSRIPEPELMEQIFGKIYNKKRLAPGGVTRVDPMRIMHNCTTLGGNSGSVVLDLNTGQALGLHFSGSFLATNYAVRSDVVKKLLAGVYAGHRTRREARTSRSASTTVPRRPDSTFRLGQRGSPSFTIPLTITMSFGDVTGPAPSARRYRTASTADRASVVEGDEAPAADYRDRGGYEPNFLGKEEFACILPSVERASDDVLDFEFQGKSESELRYEHFSVVMSRSRRMCFFSAVNIDGNMSKKSKRVGWKWDPRIPKAQQIMNECYGSPPKFSRGHMTRREDPGWGDARTARRGNEDSMHVTNATPQMQAFNAPIWLALEDYALGHAKEDEMKISTFTGPYFTDQDPEMYGVQIPLAFWKIIAFIHDETGELCATGYEMNQENAIQPDEEFVFGAFTSPQLGTATQVPIRSIETRCGINFGNLASIDALASNDESLANEEWTPLEALEQIRFIR